MSRRPRSPTLRILLVDDDEVDRIAVRRALAASGLEAELHEAEDAAAGLRASEEEPFDAVLLDYYLPGSDGLQVIRPRPQRGFPRRR